MKKSLIRSWSKLRILRSIAKDIWRKSMYNRFIHMLFNSSILMPFILAIGLSKTFIEKNFKTGLTITVISFGLAAIQVIILRTAKKNIVPQRINISKISQEKESWVLAIYVSYFVPFIESSFGKNFNFTNWILVVIGIIILILSKRTTNNPVLSVLGYKVYSIETDHGIDMTLISKRDIRNKKAIDKVLRIFEYYVMEA